jgi:carbamate kinase
MRVVIALGGNALLERGEKPDAEDPAFASPAKFVGPVYEEAQARQLAAVRGWAIAQDGHAWRRVVPSPQPIQVVETEMIAQLADGGTIVVCAGGGGIPAIGRLDQAEALLDGEAGTIITCDSGSG